MRTITKRKSGILNSRKQVECAKREIKKKIQQNVKLGRLLHTRGMNVNM